MRALAVGRSGPVAGWGSAAHVPHCVTSSAGVVFCASVREPALAGALTACRWSPFRRVRGSEQMNTLQCARHVYRTEGIRGFYRGLTASYAGISETVICFAIYEGLKKYLKDAPLAPSTSGTEKNSTNFFGLMAAAAVSKGCASCIAYPHGMCHLLSQIPKTAVRFMLLISISRPGAQMKCKCLQVQRN